MKELLREKMHQYIVANNPELLLRPESFSVPAFVNDKLQVVAEQLVKWEMEKLDQAEIIRLALLEMTASIRPSRFLLLKDILREEYPLDYERLLEQGMLTSFLADMIGKCAQVFESFQFSEETQYSRYLHHALIVELHQELIR